MAEAEVVVSAGAAATVDLDHHPRETGLWSVLISQGAQGQVGARGQVGVQDARRALQCYLEAGSTLHHPMRENQGEEVAPPLGMRGVLMVLIMVAVLDQGAEAPWKNLKEKALGMKILEALTRRTAGIVVQARIRGVTEMERRMMRMTTKLLPEAVNNLLNASSLATQQEARLQ